MRKLKRTECVILPLVLKRRWYDMIASGEKLYESKRREREVDALLVEIDNYGKPKQGELL